MNIGKLFDFLKALKSEIDSVSTTENKFFTLKTKKRLMDSIDEALEKKEANKSLAIIVDNIVHMSKDNDLLKKIGKISFLTKKINDMTQDWIQTEYFDAKDQNKDRQTADDLELKKKSELEKEDATEEDKKSVTTAYFKLIKEIGQAITDMELHFQKTRFKETDERETAKKEMGLLERLFKKLKSSVSDEMKKDDVETLISKIEKAKDSYKDSIFTDHVDVVSKKLTKFADKVLTESVETLVEYSAEMSFADKISRLEKMVADETEKTKFLKALKTLRAVTKNDLDDSDIVVSVIEDLEELAEKAKTSVKQEVKALVKAVSKLAADHVKEISEDVKEGAKLIRTSYETWDEEAKEAGETDDKGWKDEKGEDWSKDVDETPAKDAGKWLKKKGVTPSSKTFVKGLTYSETNTDIKSGEETILTYHLSGWTAEEEKEIYDIVTGKKSLTESYYDKTNYLL